MSDEIIVMSKGVIQQTGVWCVEGLHPGVQIRLPLRPEGEYTPHYVAPGETLSSIAARLQIDTWTLRRSNGLFGPEEVLAPGTLLWVLRTPPPAPAIGAVAARAAATLADPAHPGDPTDQHEAPQVHRVAPGETLAAIARRYSTSVAAIQAANGLGRRTLIRAGDHLKIPGTVAVR